MACRLHVYCHGNNIVVLPIRCVAHTRYTMTLGRSLNIFLFHVFMSSICFSYIQVFLKYLRLSYISGDPQFKDTSTHLRPTDVNLFSYSDEFMHVYVFVCEEFMHVYTATRKYLHANMKIFFVYYIVDIYRTYTSYI